MQFKTRVRCKLETCKRKVWDPPLLFNILQDPSEAYYLFFLLPSDVLMLFFNRYPLNTAEEQYKNIVDDITAKKTAWEKNFEFGHIVEGGGEEYAVCCDRTKNCICN